MQQLDYISADESDGLCIVFWSLDPNAVGLGVEIINMEDNKELRNRTYNQFLNEREKGRVPEC